MKKIILLITMAIATGSNGEDFAEEYQAASLFAALIGADNPSTVSPTPSSEEETDSQGSRPVTSATTPHTWRSEC